MIKTTNAMRLLKQAGIEFKILEYDYDEDHLNGEHAADQVGVPYEQVFKTLVVRGEKKGIMVFCIPVNKELDLKKAAASVKDKKIELIPVKDLLGLTGYMRGGCSPVGMKKSYPTYVDDTAAPYEEICISAGIRGAQLVLNPEKLVGYLRAEFISL